MKKDMLRIILAASITALFTLQASAQQKLFVAFYNQENLFDTINDPAKNDEEFLPTSKKEWNTPRYQTKINHMAKVIASMNENNAPDVLGMCEVENDLVLSDLTADEQLKKARYKFVHVDGPDERSIDNALLYKTSAFKFINSKSYPVHSEAFPDMKTRDILLVRLEAKNKAQIVFLVNHFPSRMGGEKESEPRRFAAANVLRNIVDSLYKINPVENIVIMGDFNDEPNNKSMDSVLRAKASEYDLNNGNLFNAMYEMKQNNEGSHYYKGQFSMLDQLILSSSITNCTGTVCYEKASATVYKQPWMLEQEGKYKGAPLRTFVGDKYFSGYSDHLPVYVILGLKKK
jgi:predicted extracellular nuclease